MRMRKVELMPGEMVDFIPFFLPLLCLPNASSTSLIHFDFHRFLDRARPTVCREKEQEPITISLTLHNERDR